MTRRAKLPTRPLRSLFPTPELRAAAERLLAHDLLHSITKTHHREVRKVLASLWKKPVTQETDVLTIRCTWAINHTIAKLRAAAEKATHRD